MNASDLKRIVASGLLAAVVQLGVLPAAHAGGLSQASTGNARIVTKAVRPWKPNWKKGAGPSENTQLTTAVHIFEPIDGVFHHNGNSGQSEIFLGGYENGTASLKVYQPDTQRYTRVTLDEALTNDRSGALLHQQGIGAVGKKLVIAGGSLTWGQSRNSFTGSKRIFQVSSRVNGRAGTATQTKLERMEMPDLELGRTMPLVGGSPAGTELMVAFGVTKYMEQGQREFGNGANITIIGAVPDEKGSLHVPIDKTPVTDAKGNYKRDSRGELSTTEKMRPVIEMYEVDGATGKYVAMKNVEQRYPGLISKAPVGRYGGHIQWVKTKYKTVDEHGVEHEHKLERIFFIGGSKSNQLSEFDSDLLVSAVPTSDIDFYDVHAKTWGKIEMPTPRMVPGVAVRIDEHGRPLIDIAGGKTGRNAVVRKDPQLNSLETLDPVTLKWVGGNTLPQPEAVAISNNTAIDMSGSVLLHRPGRTFKGKTMFKPESHYLTFNSAHYVGEPEPEQRPGQPSITINVHETDVKVNNTEINNIHHTDIKKTVNNTEINNTAVEETKVNQVGLFNRMKMKQE